MRLLMPRRRTIDILTDHRALEVTWVDQAAHLESVLSPLLLEICPGATHRIQPTHWQLCSGEWNTVMERRRRCTNLFPLCPIGGLALYQMRPILRGRIATPERIRWTVPLGCHSSRYFVLSSRHDPLGAALVSFAHVVRHNRGIGVAAVLWTLH